ncbi:hypothetical protein [uncultured Acetobacteroides sp.]|uniref:hypothetical protein n=1 Tax=uncultured Acetobacteroides sp. TaxID=1760811 RepID=UPI0029F4F354|nr:hypothetical protein [uncultured Acetobacteroides sp.]
MKKLSIADIKASEILSKDERLIVVGGYDNHYDGLGGVRCFAGGIEVSGCSNKELSEAGLDHGVMCRCSLVD